MGIPFINSPFADTKTEYPVPVPIPIIEPDSNPLVSVSLNCLWLHYVIGACKALLQEEAWDTDDPTQLTQVLGQSQKLLDIMIAAAQTSACENTNTPFSCSGDFAITGDPFGTFTIGCVGFYLGGFGYGGSQGLCGGSYYFGVDVQIDLGAPFFIGRVQMDYDLTKDTSHPGNAFDLVFVQNLDTSGFMGTPLTGAVTVDGDGQVYDTGPISQTAQHIRLFVGAGADSVNDVSGVTVLHGVILQGTGSTSPCP